MRSTRIAAARDRGGAVAALFAFLALASSAADAETCRSAVGDRQSARLVERCIAVSPATHPPCHADNPCALIESEIVRGCRMIDDGTAPAYCRDY